MAGLVLTPEWAEEIYQLETTDPVMGGPDGIDNRQAIQLGKRTEYLKQEVEKCAPLDSPKFKGIPSVPTALPTSNSLQVANTAFVKAAIANLVGSAPTTLDTLAEIATALGSDGNLKATLLAEIAKKTNNTDYINLKNLLVGIPFPYPLAVVPSGCLAFNGQTFNKTTYPELAKKYPSGKLPDLRGEFIRGWDNGRGVDSGRVILTSQSDDFKSHHHISPNVGSKWTTAQADRKEVATDLPNSKGEYPNSYDYSPAIPTSDTGGAETRPRNVAFQYICLAA